MNDAVAMTRDFDFALPEELVAQEPPAARGDSRLLVLHRDTGKIEHTTFARIVDVLRTGDLLVLNNTKVFPARLLGQRLPGGGAVECLLVRQLPRPEHDPADDATTGVEVPLTGEPAAGGMSASGAMWWEALMHPGQRLKPGTRTVFDRRGVRLYGEVLARHFHGRRTIKLWTSGDIAVPDAIERIGHMPLPPYIKRDDRMADRERYQTVYARERGSIAAPTAGLHFTAGVLAALVSKGVERRELTLHVGYGTFKPMRCEQIRDHVVDPETYAVPVETAAAITRARKEGRRVVAVGTTSMRALESLRPGDDGRIHPAASETELCIRPGHTFRVADGLITNFHLPRSSLLVLVAAFVGRERLLEAYREAISRGYRFYSYGDAMAIL
ncbi:MAG: tRNA preQ1(34) S-adenosylmethionine ribosyltransferase-isomerase QueA [Acidobacteria bacterium]|nr:tRNA preQ1(34) S-adenosylmethionine ribosyltransferase-isomerase QueA [Acidobacteriota bacterium]